MDVRAYNRIAWDKEVERGNRWSVPVSTDEIARARGGKVSMVLTPTRAVPESWLPPLRGARVLCLAAAGGQQGPLFAAAGAVVTIFDNSPRQLAQDRAVADREGLVLTTIEGDMADLRGLADTSFDLVFHPVSNCFVPDVKPVWREAFRVLRRGGALLAGFVNPILFTLDQELLAKGVLQVRYPLPYSDLSSLAPEELARYTNYHAPLEFGHTLEEQIGGQLDAGFRLAAMYEDSRGHDDPTDRYFKGFIATRAFKP